MKQPKDNFKKEVSKRLKEMSVKKIKDVKLKIFKDKEILEFIEDLLLKTPDIVASRKEGEKISLTIRPLDFLNEEGLKNYHAFIRLMYPKYADDCDDFEFTVMFVGLFAEKLIDKYGEKLLEKARKD